MPLLSADLGRRTVHMVTLRYLVSNCKDGYFVLIAD